MRFSAAVLLCVLQATDAFVPRQQQAARPSFIITRQSTATPESATATDEEKRATKKDERLRMMKSEQFHRKGFKEVRDSVESTMQQQFQSSIVKDLRESNYLMEKDGVKVYLAKVRRLRWTATKIGSFSHHFAFVTGLWLLLGCRTKYCAGL